MNINHLTLSLPFLTLLSTIINSERFLLQGHWVDINYNITYMISKMSHRFLIMEEK